MHTSATVILILPLSGSQGLVGQRVQWISQGVEVWPEPRVVRSVQTAQIGGETHVYAFFEHSPTGISITELILR